MLDAASAALPMTAGLLTGASADDEDAMVLWPLLLLTAQRTQLPPRSAAGGRVSALGPAHKGKVRAKLWLQHWMCFTWVWLLQMLSRLQGVRLVLTCLRMAHATG